MKQQSHPVSQQWSSPLWEASETASYVPLCARAAFNADSQEGI